MLTCFTPEHPVRGIARHGRRAGSRALDDASLCDHARDPRLPRAGAHRASTASPRASRTSALSLLDSMGVRRLAREHLRELRARTGHTVGLAILDDSEVLLHRPLAGRAPGAVRNRLGGRAGLAPADSLLRRGQGLLARLPEAEQRELIAKLRLDPAHRARRSPPSPRCAPSSSGSPPTTGSRSRTRSCSSAAARSRRPCSTSKDGRSLPSSWPCPTTPTPASSSSRNSRRRCSPRRSASAKRSVDPTRRARARSPSAAPRRCPRRS